MSAIRQFCKRDFTKVDDGKPEKSSRSDRLRHGNERFPCSHDNRLGQVNPAAFAHGRRVQQAQALAGAKACVENGAGDLVG